MWDNDALFHMYIYDYCLKRNFIQTANTFSSEANINTEQLPPIDSPEGFLFEWWSVFWDIFHAKIPNGNVSQDATNYVENQAKQKRSPKIEENVPQNHGITPQLMSFALSTLGWAGRDINTLTNDEKARLLAVIKKQQQMQLQVQMQMRNPTPQHMQQQMFMQQMQQQQGIAATAASPDLKRQRPVNTTTFPTAQTMPPQAPSSASMKWNNAQLSAQQIQLLRQQQLRSQQMQMLQNQQHQMMTGQSVSPVMQNSVGVGGIAQPNVAMSNAISGVNSQEIQYRNNIIQQTQQQKHRMMQQQSGSKKRKATNEQPKRNTFKQPQVKEEEEEEEEEEEQMMPEMDMMLLAEENPDLVMGAEPDLSWMGSELPIEVAEPIEFKKQLQKKDSVDASLFPLGELKAHSNKVSACVFSSDCKILASVGHDKKVLIWDVVSQQLKQSFDKHTNQITCARFNNDNPMRLLATSSYDKTVKVWQIEEGGGLIYSFDGHGKSVTAVDFLLTESADVTCASIDAEGEVFIWSASSGHVTKTMSLTSNEKYSGYSSNPLRAHPFQANVFAAAVASSLSFIDITDNSEPKTIATTHEKNISSLAWSNDGRYFASASDDLLCIWDCLTYRTVFTQAAQSGKIGSVCFVNDAIIFGEYETLYVWEFNHTAKNPVKVGKCHTGIVIAVDVGETEDGILLVSGSAAKDNNLKLWQVRL